MLREITQPQPYRVYQRSKDGTASIDVAGVLSAGGEVRARLVRKGQALPGMDWSECEVDGTSFSCRFDRVPVGGPYVLDVRVGDQVRRVRGLLVGDLWVLAGQSNMDGYGKLVDLEPPSNCVNCLYYSEKWGVARDPLCWLNESIDPVHWAVQDPHERAELLKHEKTFRDAGAGLGVRFGKDLYKATGVPVGLIMCSHGGTSMAQWAPELRDRGGESLYGSMLRRIEVAGGKVAGCLWYQGESDALSEDWVNYRSNFHHFIETIRADLEHPAMPFIYAQLSRFYGDEAACRDQWNSVQNDQLVLESEMSNVAVVAAIDAGVSDAIHIDSVSQRNLGARMAKLAARLAFGQQIDVGPRPVRVEFSGDTRRKIVVSFTGVNRSLSPSRGIRGFALEKDGVALPIARCTRDGDGKSVVISLPEPVPEGAALWYGRGLNPAVNLSDAEGFAAPVFGPVML